MKEPVGELWLGLGGNVGDRRARLEAAVEAIGAWPEVRRLRRSSVYETAHVGEGPGQDDHLNLVLAIETSLDPREVHRRTRRLERQAGRGEDGHGAPRTLDVDLLLHSDGRRLEGELRLPHPRLAERRFVLEPLAELGCDRPLDARGNTALDLLRSPEIAAQRVRRLDPVGARP